MKINFNKSIKISCFIGVVFVSFLLQSCQSKDKNKKENVVALPVYVVDTSTVDMTKTFLGTVEGKVNVEIRPQVEGELEQAYVDEGDHVEKGQKLFKINAEPYQQDLNRALANENVARSKLANAKLEVERLKPLIENEVMSPVRLETAKSNYNIAQAELKQASAEVAHAQIKIGYTQIKAPVSGYIGRIPKRIGNVVKPSDKEPITVLSEVNEVYVYFSISETNFYQLLQSASVKDSLGNDIKRATQNIDTTQTISLILSNGTIYPKKGIIDASSGQVNKSTGSILLRSTFPNSGNMLRSGNTVTVLLEQKQSGKIVIPQRATFDLLAKSFVKKLLPDNTVERQAIKIAGELPGNRYLVDKGLKKGDRILVEGLNKITDSVKIKPLPYQPDTLIAPKVLDSDEDFDSISTQIDKND